MAEIRQFLSLSNNHLPAELGLGGLPGADGVIAWPTDEGWLLWVPSDPDDSNLYEIDGIDPIVLRIQQHARSHGCDYVLFDADAPLDDDLPVWEW